MRKIALVFLVAGSLSGCAVYHATPLPQRPDLSTQPPRPIMSMGAVGRYALAHSPDLVIARRQADVGVAQADEGGLLPDPQFSGSVDHPTIQGPGLGNGYAMGLGEDLQALLTEPSRAAGASAKAKQAKLDLLWVEWQTLQKAARLYTQKIYADEKLDRLTKTANILQDQAQHATQALKQHNTTIDVAGADLSTALDIASQREAAARSALATDADIKALLGLLPSANLKLVDPGDPPVITRKMVERALDSVMHRRPDLLALQAGYHAQDEVVRAAILEQFPAINLGFNRASDTSNIQSNGVAVTVNIPIFGSTQAKIRTERATRAELRAEYQTRLDQTIADAWRIWQMLDLVRRQVKLLEESLPNLHKMADAGQTAYAAGNLAPATYTVLETSLSAREGELFDLKAILWDNTIALKTLLAITPLIPQASDAK